MSTLVQVRHLQAWVTLFAGADKVDDAPPSYFWHEATLVGGYATVHHSFGQLADTLVCFGDVPRIEARMGVVLDNQLNRFGTFLANNPAS
jgi:hypothetical protein